MKTWTYTPLTAIRSIEDAEAFQQSMREYAAQVWPRWAPQMEHRACPACAADKPKNERSFADSFPVARCAVCRTLYVNPVPTDEQLQGFYRQAAPIRLLNEIYARRKPAKAGFVSDIRTDRVIRCLAENERAASARPAVLEIGCNNGRFLEGLVDAGSKRGVQFDRVVGIDIDDSVLPSESSSRVEFLPLSLEQAKARSDLRQSFDLVCHFELIEHLREPHDFMQALHAVLKPGGFMVLTTPNAAGMEMEAAGYDEKRLLSHSIFPPMHLNAFSTFNFTLFAVRSGFQVVSIETPGRLDVDCVRRYAQARDEIDDEFQSLCDLDEDILARIQALVARLCASSTLLAVLRKPEDG